MNIFGMGPLEILVIALIAFILLGPQRMVDAARLLGKTTKEVRRLTDELPKIVLDEEQGRPANESSTRSEQDAREKSGEPDDENAVGESPVAFRSADSRSDRGKPEHTQGRDT